MIKFIGFIAFFILGIFANAADTIKANIVNESGVVIGQKNIRDLRLCGTYIGHRRIAEEHLKETGSMFLDCATRFEVNRISTRDWPGAEVRTLVQQGPSSNRIDLTIVGDGYTAAEKAKFFSDAKLITEDLFGQDTFATYLPLFNIHAVFVPSNQSGIGDGDSIDTALKLYRDSEHRQVILPGDPLAARSAVSLAPDTDYPILLANDKFYGGLGGEFAITTSSPLNLTTVLRHELGHNFGQVGEEYDGGQVYDGANFSPTLDVGWKHFLRSRATGYRAELLYYAAPWHNLSQGPIDLGVALPNGMKRLYIDFSSLGMDTPEDVGVYLDGTRIRFQGQFNYDRNFYRIEVQLSPGTHRLEFRELKNDANNIISKISLYGLPDGFPMDTSLVDGFVTYNYLNTPVGYRPTENFCLMRDMTSHKFCSVCVENMWRNFLREVSLIDDVTQAGSTITAAVMPLTGRLAVRWIDPTGKHRPEMDQMLKWESKPEDKGEWTFETALISTEIKDPNQADWSIHTKRFNVQ